MPWRALLSTPFWIVAAALIASWYPAWRGSRTAIAETLREE
jgi:ABC-type lipoprotein release transport system permease subunit